MAASIGIMRDPKFSILQQEILPFSLSFSVLIKAQPILLEPRSNPRILPIAYIVLNFFTNISIIFLIQIDFLEKRIIFVEEFEANHNKDYSVVKTLRFLPIVLYRWAFLFLIAIFLKSIDYMEIKQKQDTENFIESDLGKGRTKYRNRMRPIEIFI
jgi:hypothetical protein